MKKDLSNILLERSSRIVTEKQDILSCRLRCQLMTFLVFGQVEGDGLLSQYITKASCDSYTGILSETGKGQEVISKTGKDNLSLDLQFPNCPKPGSSNDLVASFTLPCSLYPESQFTNLVFGNGYLCQSENELTVEKYLHLPLKILIELNYFFYLLIYSIIK